MRHSHVFKSLRNAFFAGVVVLAPLAVTVWVFNWLIEIVGGRYSKLIFFWLPERFSQEQFMWLWNVLSTVIVLLFVTLLGYLSGYVATKFFFNVAERVMQRVPLISVVYNTVKQIIDTFTSQRRAVFEKVVLIPFPRDGSHAIGFLTNRSGGEIQCRTEEEVWNVFVPTTPNPTSGFLIMVPKRDIVELEMSVGEGMKLIISGGGVMPPWPPAQFVPVPSPEGVVVATGPAPAPPPPPPDPLHGRTTAGH